MKRNSLLVPALLGIILVPFLAGCEGKTNPEPKSYFVDLYAANDVHGRIVEKKITNYKYEPGLAKTATFINQLKEEKDNFIFLNSGDMFQDTYDSYSNKGNLMAKLMPMMHTEAMAIGNHEFDWGADALIKNRELSKGTTYLSSNIYHYDKDNDRTLEFASDIGEEYKIIDRDGLKIGVIGVIGKDQITSIYSKLVEDYIFLEPTPIVKRISDVLKGEKGCDAVVLAAHADFSQLQEQSHGAFARGITSISNVTNKRYVDAVFTAHTHQNQKDIYNKVPFIQSGAHGEELGYIRLDLSKENENPKLVEYDHIDIPHTIKPDEEVQSLIDSYLNDEFYDKKNSPIGTTDINKLYRDKAGQMLAWMTYETLMEDTNNPVKNIDVVLNNGGRSKVEFKDGKISRGDIFDAIPFTNTTVIAKVKGSDLLKNVRDFEYPYYAPKEITIDLNETYNVAVIDYLLYHKDANRKFNYFNNFKESDALYHYNKYCFDIVSDYIINHKSDSGVDLKFADITYKKEYSNITNA